jgi:ketoreductase RED2
VKVAIVTGSSSGIGEATARSLAAAGYGVVVNSSSSVEAGQHVAASLPNAVYLQGDVSDEAQCHALVAATVERFGRLDVVVNNAGTTKLIPHHDLDAVTDEIFQRILSVNVMGTWHLIRSAMPHLKAKGDGVIVNISSIAGLKPGGSSIPYAVSKAAINHMTKLVAAVAGPEVRVNAVCPGLIATPWTADRQAERDSVAKVAPLRRVGTPEDIATAVMGVIEAKYMTGQLIAVDGGLTQR